MSDSQLIVMRGFGQQRLVQGKAAWLGLRRGASAGLELLDMGRAAMVPPLFCRSTSRFDSLVQTISMLRMQSCSDQHTRGYTIMAGNYSLPTHATLTN